MVHQEILKTLDAMAIDPGYSADFVLLLRRMVVAQEKAQEMAEGLYSNLVGTGAAPLRPAAVLVEPALVEGLVDALLEAPGNQGAGDTEMQRLAAALRGKPALCRTIVRACTGRVDMAALKRVATEAGTSAFGVLMAGRMIAKPFVKAAAVRLLPHFKAPTLSDTAPGRCPQCDAPASFALLVGKEGHRQLMCSSCDLIWPFPRLKCPTCGNSDSDKLLLLQLGDDQTRRVEACEVCRRYMKTIDQRKLPPGFPVHASIEAAACLHLDIAAEGRKLVLEVM